MSRPVSSASPLARVTSAIVACNRCPRLRGYCQHIAREKRAAYRHEDYWGKPVPGFGDPHARVVVLGLAPAAHGANRTGRVFTGDGAGGSGDFLMGALNRAGFANIATSTHPDDGLTLRDAYIIATVRCAPPDNKPLPEEIASCADHLDAELAALPRLRVVVALGKIAWDAWFQHLARRGHAIHPRPPFSHGARYNAPATLGTQGIRGTLLFACYHPSRQNTNTGRVTARMYDEIFAGVRRALSGEAARVTRSSSA